jgi:putative membrane protein
MVSDHSKANDELKQLASKKGIELPAQPPMDAHMQKLQGLSGAEFDREYMSHMLNDHQKDVAAFKKEASGGRDPDVKAFAAKTLPTLESHLQMVKQNRPAHAGKPMKGAASMAH